MVITSEDLPTIRFRAHYFFPSARCYSGVQLIRARDRQPIIIAYQLPSFLLFRFFIYSSFPFRRLSQPAVTRFEQNIVSVAREMLCDIAARAYCQYALRFMYLPVIHVIRIARERQNSRRRTGFLLMMYTNKRV